MNNKDKYTGSAIGQIGNYYGGLLVMELNGKYYWTIEDVTGTHVHNLEEWEEIDKELYVNLMRYKYIE